MTFQEDYDPKNFDDMIAFRRKAVKPPDPEKIGSFLLLDNCFYEKNQINDKCMRECFGNGRCHRLLFIITMAYSIEMNGFSRGNTDYIFILRESIISNRKRLYDHWASGLFKTFEIFCDVLDTVTSDYECLVIDNREGKYYKYKATISN